MKKNSSIILGVVGAICIIAFFAMFFMGKGDNSNFPFERYVEQPKSFAGNSYSLSASIDSQLAYADNKGRIILLKTFENKSLPLFVPAAIEGFNPNTGQRYSFQVRIAGDGKLVMEKFKKL